MEDKIKKELMGEIQNAIWSIENAKTIHYRETGYTDNYDDYKSLNKMVADLKAIGNRVNK